MTMSATAVVVFVFRNLLPERHGNSGRGTLLEVHAEAYVQCTALAANTLRLQIQHDFVELLL